MTTKPIPWAACLAMITAIFGIAGQAPAQSERPGADPLISEQTLRTAVDTSESRRLAQQRDKHESQAASLAEQYRGLVKTPAAERANSPTLEDLRQQIETELNSAFDLKCQIEQLRVREMQARLSRLEQQIGRRQTRRLQIVERRSQELIAGEETAWTNGTEEEAGRAAADQGDASSAKTLSQAKAFQSRGQSPASAEFKRPDVVPSGSWVRFSPGHRGAPESQTTTEAVPGDRQASFPLLPSYQELTTRLARARDELIAAQRPLAQGATTNEEISLAHSRLEASKRNYQYLQDEYSAILRDLQLQVDAGKAELDFAERKSSRLNLLRDRGVVSAAEIDEAQLKLTQTKLALERLTTRLDLYKKGIEGVADPLKAELANSSAQTSINRLGLRLRVLTADEWRPLGIKKWRGGLRILEVDPDGPCGKSGLRKDDILVGIDKWEATSVDNVVWIMNQIEEQLSKDGPQQRKIFVQRGEETRFSDITLAPVSNKGAADGDSKRVPNSQRTSLPFDSSPLKPGDRRILTVEGVEFAFRWIPPTTALPDTFKMGTPTSEPGHTDFEKQVDVVLTQGYWMLETEVTQEMYLSVMKVKPWQGKDHVKDGSAFPACYVSWNDANDFCERLTQTARRILSSKERIALPTEAQWEWAARAGTTTAYVSGNDDSKLGDFAWYDKNAWDVGETYAHQVGLKKPNAWGLLDISGNLWEWCSDYYGSSLPGGTNPKGPSAGSSRALRGGSFDRFTSSDRIGFRGDLDPTLTFFNIGFRIVCVSE